MIDLIFTKRNAGIGLVIAVGLTVVGLATSLVPALIIAAMIGAWAFDIIFY